MHLLGGSVFAHGVFRLAPFCSQAAQRLIDRAIGETSRHQWHTDCSVPSFKELPTMVASGGDGSLPARTSIANAARVGP